MIIHISGASGSGKTTLGKRLKEYFGNKVIVKDLDDLREELFVLKEQTNISFKKLAKNYATIYQQHIDNFVKRFKKKNIIFVGLNTYIRGEIYYFKGNRLMYPKVFFNLHSNYNFYIDADPDTILRQRFDREYIIYIDWFTTWMKDRKEILFNNLMNDEETAKNDVCEALTRIMHFNRIRDDIQSWDDFYKSKGYEFLSQNKLFNRIIKLML